MRRGKVIPLKALEKFSNQIEIFNCLGVVANCSATLLGGFENFVCFMYGKANYTSVNSLRYDLFSLHFRPGTKCF